MDKEQSQNDWLSWWETFDEQYATDLHSNWLENGIDRSIDYTPTAREQLEQFPVPIKRGTWTSIYIKARRGQCKSSSNQNEYQLHFHILIGEEWESLCNLSKANQLALIVLCSSHR